LQIGEVVRAMVTRAEVYGLYLSSRGEGLLVLIPEVAWTTEVRDCRDFAKVGDEFDVKVQAHDERTGVYWGSIKAAHPEADPWQDPTAFHPGTVWVSTVTHRYSASTPKWGPSGYIVRLRPGVSGFLREADVGKDLAVGDQVEVQVAEADARSRKIWLKPSLGRGG
jgi:ribosomal protein S1